MYQKVLVPLDGSRLAEETLPHVLDLAKAHDIGEVILLNVVDTPSFWVMESIDLSLLRNQQIIRAEQYLEGVCSQLIAEGIKTTGEIKEGRAAQVITGFAKENGCDLIVIASHGYTGFKQWALGSVALRVLHDSHVPVLLIRPESHQM